MSSTSKIKPVQHYLNEFQQFTDRNPSDEILKEIMLLVFDSAHENNLVTLNEVLLLTEPSKIEPLICISLLRGSFSLKHNLSNWQTFRDKVKSDFLQRDLDPDKLMRGLLTY